MVTLKLDNRLLAIKLTVRNEYCNKEHCDMCKFYNGRICKQFKRINKKRLIWTKY